MAPMTRSKRRRKVTSALGKHIRTAGTHCVWPLGVERMFGISGCTRWRWERLGKLPPRDYFVAGEAVGWHVETLNRAARGQPTPASA